jgi:hypothetical protein
MPRPLTSSGRVLAAFSFAMLCSLRQVTMWTDPLNRFLFHWQLTDGVALACSILLLSLLVLATERWTRPRRFRFLRRVVTWAFVLSLDQVALSNAVRMSPDSAGVPAAVAAIALVGLTLVLLQRSERRLISLHTQLCLVLSPLPLVLLLQVFSWKPWQSCEYRSYTRPAAKAGRPPVFVFIFDDWSPSRSLMGGEFEPWLPRLNRLAATSSVFLDARSPGTQTLEALPEILFQQPGLMRVGNGELRWVTSSADVSTSRGLLDTSHRFGYSNELLGFYLPYAALLGNRVDYCLTFTHVPKSVGLARGIVAALLSNLQYLPDPFSQELWAWLYARTYSYNWFDLNRRLRQETLQAIGSSTSGSMTFVHFPLPHAPFIFEADGRFAGPFTAGRMDGTSSDYERQLRFLDLVVGEFQDAMIREKLFNTALVIVTSDHSWRADPDGARRNSDLVHKVPLIIKWPGQTTSRVVSAPVCLTSLHLYLEAAIVGRPEAEADVAAVAPRAREDCR